MHRQESRVLAGLDLLILAGQMVPCLRGTVERGPWFALAIDEVDGRQPVVPCGGIMSWTWYWPRSTGRPGP